MERLQHIVQCLARPIEFASRDSYAHLSTVKNLGPFVSRQVVEALADRVYPPAVETDLLTLRQLFADYDTIADQAERRRRLVGARAILDRLSETDLPSEGPDRERVAPPPPIPSPAPLAQELWTIPIRFAKGVGPKRAALIERLGVKTVEEALWFLPWRYEDRATRTPIGQLSAGSRATICGVVQRSELKRTARRGLTILDVTIDDTTGILHGVFFNQSYLEKMLKPGARVMLSGVVSAGRKGWIDLKMDSPQYEVLGEDHETPLHVGRIVPIYHETKGLTSRLIRAVLKGLLDQYVASVEDVLPAPLRARRRFPSIAAALAEVHFPSSPADLTALERGVTPAHRRLAFEEFFVLELALALRQRSVKEEVKGLRFDGGGELVARVRALLPFQLTAAQDRVLSEIQRDMASLRPMNRLIQGDVGCGKTIVALCAILIACGSGYQAALMVPTEILAEQHYFNLRQLLQELGVEAVLLKSGGAAKARAAALRKIETGEAQVVIGTHALIQKGVQFARLGLAVIDEQHKFGVLQRKTLVEKGYRPDVLVLTATPIPRTLAMTVYGDLDISIIDALPPGRKPVRTWLFSESQRRKAYRVVQDELQAGRQAYIVYPLIEESEKVDLQAAIQGAEKLQAAEFRAFRVGLLHGRLKAEEKERTMAAFKAGEIQVLVATTVIEVGVDVPNATVMLVEHAERFGLAQLHQLRGRVGRSGQQSFCLLLASGRRRAEEEGNLPTGQTGAAGSQPARRRLDALVKSTDGFVIAEEDLRIRGPGEFFGVRQWGVPEFRAANLIRDAALLEEARQEAFALLASDPHLGHPGHRGVKALMLRRWKEKLDLGAIS
ncbi:MAG: ATP-dependent DNA helicase RecG [Nitrospirae bacterium]|nr:MAG: ATP-dependent DNA helicase RecG [Nitrospirota bacterium]